MMIWPITSNFIRGFFPKIKWRDLVWSRGVSMSCMLRGQEAYIKENADKKYQRLYIHILSEYVVAITKCLMLKRAFDYSVRVC